MRIASLTLASALVLATPPGETATLVETSVGGQSVWVLDDADRDRVLVASRAGNRLIDLDTRTVYMIAPDGTAQKIDAGALPDPADTAPPYTLEKVGPGPRIAGYPTTRFRLSAGGRTCSIIDANLSLARPLSRAIRAFALLDRVGSALGGASRPPCQRVPFTGYARIGWGLRIEDAGSATVETMAVIRNYEPLAEELSLPADALDITRVVLDGGVAAPPK